MKLSIIVATKGRSTLARMARSMVGAGIRSCDEVVVITDGKVETKQALACLPASVIVKRHPATDGKFCSGVLRNYGMPLASGDFLMFMDDDDVYTHGALDRVRYHIEMTRAAAGPMLFRMVAHWGEVLWRSFGKWRQNPVSFRNVGTPMFVIPNQRSRLGKWGTGRSSDWHFISTTLPKWPKGSTILVDDVICVCDPSNTRGRHKIGWARRVVWSPDMRMTISR